MKGLTPHHLIIRFSPEKGDQTSIAYLGAGGRLGNAMSSYAAMLALRHQFGMDAMVDLTTFQLLDIYFTNVREVPVLEEKVCDYMADIHWTEFDQHVSQLNTSRAELATGKARAK